jgi:hypothetical protein
MAAAQVDVPVEERERELGIEAALVVLVVLEPVLVLLGGRVVGLAFALVERA